MAESIVVNAKTQRPGVCNAAEQLLVHRGAAAALLPLSLIHIYDKTRHVLQAGYVDLAAPAGPRPVTEANQ